MAGDNGGVFGNAWNATKEGWNTISNKTSDAYESTKEWGSRQGDKISNFAAKESNTFTGAASDFMDGGDIERRGEILYNKLTGQEIPVDSPMGKKILDNRPPGEASNDENTENLGNRDDNLQEATFNEIYTATGNSATYKKEASGKAKAIDIPGEKDVPWSAFNKWSLFNYKGGPLDSGTPNYNRPMNVGPDFAQKRNPSGTYIINQTNELENKAYKYSFADFALAKYYGKISNNYMLTLRRFPMPVEDNIINPNVIDSSGNVVKTSMPDIARAVTWMAPETGNELNNILKFDVSTAWEEVESQVQERSAAGNRGGQLGEAIGGSNILSAIYGAANGMDATAINSAKNGWDPITDTYPNHVFGPINVIKKVMIRQQGLDFNQGFELKFHYSMRQLEGVSPKIAFLDMMSNMLALTYNNGNFWGGSSRFVGGNGAFNKPFGNFSMLKSGNFSGFLGSIAGGFLKGASDILDNFTASGTGITDRLMNNDIAKNLIGGSLMKKFGTPQGSEALNAFLTGDPTGQYHLTVGNPLNPIAVIGNLYCDNADFEFGGELSHEGFPTDLTVTVSLKPARPRDKADIERMFNGGKQRMYLQPEDGVDINANTNNSAYGNADTQPQADIYRKMTNG
jgi:hypothetical protein